MPTLVSDTKNDFARELGSVTQSGHGAFVRGNWTSLPHVEVSLREDFWQMECKSAIALMNRWELEAEGRGSKKGRLFFLLKMMERAAQRL